MQFLTYPYAGDAWLESRLNRYLATMMSQESDSPRESLEISLVNCDTVVAKKNPPTDLPTIHIVRNPLAVLMSFCDTKHRLTAGETPHKDFVHQSFSAWLNSKAPSNKELAQCRRSADKMISVAMKDKDRDGQIHVRIEDFAAFPGATLRRICKFFEANCPIELIRCFVNADKPVRRKSRFARSFYDSPDMVVPLAAAAQEAQSSQNHDKMDLFSWVDHVPSAIAGAFVARHEEFFDSYYPEVYGLFAGSESSRRAA